MRRQSNISNKMKIKRLVNQLCCRGDMRANYFIIDASCPSIRVNFNGNDAMRIDGCNTIYKRNTASMIINMSHNIINRHGNINLNITKQDGEHVIIDEAWVSVEELREILNTKVVPLVKENVNFSKEDLQISSREREKESGYVKRQLEMYSPVACSNIFIDRVATLQSLLEYQEEDIAYHFLSKLNSLVIGFEPLENYAKEIGNAIESITQDCETEFAEDESFENYVSDKTLCIKYLNQVIDQHVEGYTTLNEDFVNLLAEGVDIVTQRDYYTCLIADKLFEILGDSIKKDSNAFEYLSELTTDLLKSQFGVSWSAKDKGNKEEELSTER